MAAYQRKIDKTQIPTCNILDVNIAAVNMEWLLDFTEKNIKDLSGDYMCVANVHTIVTAHEDEGYRAIQNGGIMAIPDGGPLASVGRKRGYPDMERIPGPDYMDRILGISEKKGYRHYFYGSTKETLNRLCQNLKDKYPRVQIVGAYAPPFHPMGVEEDIAFVKKLNRVMPDFVWIGLGAPKQERWMSIHQGRIQGFMIGVGAGFDYLAGNIKRAPKWMQKSNLEWIYRLLQDPKRLFWRYWHTNIRFIWKSIILKK